MIKVFGITIFFVSLLCNLSAAEDKVIFEGVPSQYSQCIKTEQKYKTVSILKCDYSISTDKTNSPETEKFLQCRFQYPQHGELAGLSCQYVSNEGNPVVPKILKCLKDGANYFPGIADDRPCVLRFYNPAYIFPKNFQECKIQGGEMSQTYMGQETCRITIELCAAAYNETYCTEVYNKKESEVLLNQCRELGGHFEKSLGELPQCELVFIDE